MVVVPRLLPRAKSPYLATRLSPALFLTTSAQVGPSRLAPTTRQPLDAPLGCWPSCRPMIPMPSCRAQTGSHRLRHPLRSNEMPVRLDGGNVSSAKGLGLDR